MVGVPLAAYTSRRALPRGSLSRPHPRWNLIRAVRRLGSGRAIEEPVYLFDKHTRAPRARLVEPAEFVVMGCSRCTIRLDATARPMAEKYVLRTERFADLAVSGVNPIEESIAAAKHLLRQAA